GLPAMVRRAAACGMVVLLCGAMLAGPGASQLPHVPPSDAGLNAEALRKIDEAMSDGIDHARLPGAVVGVVRSGKLGFLKAYGLRSKQPSELPMTVDTVFDLASLTKPVATATAVMMLVERGKLRLTDRVVQHWPEFSQNGKDKITFEHLLLHTSGLIPDNPISDYEDGREMALARVCALKLVDEPGSKFIYSDVGYIVLGELVGRVSGEPLDVFCQRNIFAPLAMQETTFHPSAALIQRAAPT